MLTMVDWTKETVIKNLPSENKEKIKLNLKSNLIVG